MAARGGNRNDPISLEDSEDDDPIARTACTQPLRQQLEGRIPDPFHHNSSSVPLPATSNAHASQVRGQQRSRPSLPSLSDTIIDLTIDFEDDTDISSERSPKSPVNSASVSNRTEPVIKNATPTSQIFGPALAASKNPSPITRNSRSTATSNEGAMTAVAQESAERFLAAPSPTTKLTIRAPANDPSFLSKKTPEAGKDPRPSSRTDRNLQLRPSITPQSTAAPPVLDLEMTIQASIAGDASDDKDVSESYETTSAGLAGGVSSNPQRPSIPSSLSSEQPRRIRKTARKTAHSNPFRSVPAISGSSGSYPPSVGTASPSRITHPTQAVATSSRGPAQVLASHTPMQPPQNSHSPVYSSILSSERPLESVFPNDHDPLAAAKDAMLAHLNKLNAYHAASIKHLLRRQRTSLDRDALAKQGKHAHLANLVPGVIESQLQTEDPFAEMKPINVPKKGSGARNQIEVAVVVHGSFTKTKKSSVYVPTTVFKSAAGNVPSYSEYVHLKSCVLVENEDTLLYWPPVDAEGEVRHEMECELKSAYFMDNWSRPEQFEQMEKCRIYESCVNDILMQLDLDWSTVLFGFLAPVNMIRDISTTPRDSEEKELDVYLQEHLKQLHYEQEQLDKADAQFSDVQRKWESGAERGPAILERLNEADRRMRDALRRPGGLLRRQGTEWKPFFSKLVQPPIRSLRLAAFVCVNFEKICGFSLWYLARLSQVAKEIMATEIEQLKEENTSPSEFSYRSKLCRTCHEYDCLFHGEFDQVPNKRKKDEEWVDEHPYIKNTINYRHIMNVGPNGYDNSTQSDPSKVSRKIKVDTSEAHLIDERTTFYPCNHEGSCERAQCSCARAKIHCEKTCACSASCNRRYRGCKCKSRDNGGVCTSHSCLCYTLNRECDADLCGTCGATDVLDPNNRYNEEAVLGKCCNVNMQRNRPPKTILGQSEVHGFGLYTGEKIAKGGFIGEYKGEKITTAEAERRGTVYPYKSTTYLFTVDRSQDIDSARAGNKIRFINDANASFTNCNARILLCNGVARIGLFATRDIKAGVELFFHYNYNDDQSKGFLQPKSKTKPGGGTLVAVKKPKPKTKALTGTHKIVTVKTKQKTKTEASRAGSGRQPSFTKSTSDETPSTPQISRVYTIDAMTGNDKDSEDVDMQEVPETDSESDSASASYRNEPPNEDVNGGIEDDYLIPMNIPPQADESDEYLPPPKARRPRHSGTRPSHTSRRMTLQHEVDGAREVGDSAGATPLRTPLRALGSGRMLAKKTMGGKR